MIGKILKHILVLAAAMLAAAPAAQARRSPVDNVVEFARHNYTRFTPGFMEPDPNIVIVNGTDTVSMIIPQRNLGRHDRGLYNYLFIPKGQWMFGLTASYGELNTEDIQILSLLTDIDLKGKTYAIRPSISYFFNHNQSVGLKVVYNHSDGAIGSLGVDIDDDMSFHLSDVSYVSSTYSGALSYRAYFGLDRNKRFAVFNEADLSFTSGTSDFSRLHNGEPKLTHTRINEVALNFSPGVCVFIMENVSFNLSFGVFGLKYRTESQRTNGEYDGKRVSSGANFRFNIFNINFGLGVHI